MSTSSTSARQAAPGDAQDQVQRLRRDGGTYRAIATAAGLAPSTIHDLASGRSEPTPHTTRALRKVASGSLPRARVDALTITGDHISGDNTPTPPARYPATHRHGKCPGCPDCCWTATPPSPP